MANTLYIGSLYKQFLLLLSGDVETNPGPCTKDDLLIMHVNSQSLRHKIDLVEAEYNKFDIITISETWLSQKDTNESIHTNNFHPPVRCDRPTDPQGGFVYM